MDEASVACTSSTHNDNNCSSSDNSEEVVIPEEISEQLLLDLDSSDLTSTDESPVAQITQPTTSTSASTSATSFFLPWLRSLVTACNQEMRRSLFSRIAFLFAFWHLITLLGLNVSILQLLPHSVLHFRHGDDDYAGGSRPSSTSSSYAALTPSLPRRQAPSPLPFDRYMFPAPVGTTTPRMLKRNSSHHQFGFNGSGNVFDAYNGSMSGLREIILSSDVVFMCFYAHWCYYSNAAWRALHSPSIHYAHRASFVGINCWTTRDDGACRRKFKISQFPWLGVHFNGRTIPYDGPVAELDLFHFVERFVTPVRFVETDSELLKTLKHGGKYFSTDAALLFCQTSMEGDFHDDNTSIAATKNELLQLMTKNFLSLNVLATRAMPRMSLQFLIALNGCQNIEHLWHHGEQHSQNRLSDVGLYLLRPYDLRMPVVQLPRLAVSGNWSFIRNLLSPNYYFSQQQHHQYADSASPGEKFSYYDDIFSKHVSMGTTKDFTLSSMLSFLPQPNSNTASSHRISSSQQQQQAANMSKAVEQEVGGSSSGESAADDEPPATTLLPAMSSQQRNTAQNISKFVFATSESIKVFEKLRDLTINEAVYEQCQLYRTWKLIQALYNNCHRADISAADDVAAANADKFLNAVYSEDNGYNRTAWNMINGLRCRKEPKFLLNFVSIDHVPQQSMQSILGQYDWNVPPSRRRFNPLYDEDAREGEFLPQATLFVVDAQNRIILFSWSKDPMMVNYLLNDNGKSTLDEDGELISIDTQLNAQFSLFTRLASFIYHYTKGILDHSTFQHLRQNSLPVEHVADRMARKARDSVISEEDKSAEGSAAAADEESDADSVQIFDLTFDTLREYLEGSSFIDNDDDNSRGGNLYFSGRKKYDLVVFYYTRWCGTCKRAYSAFKHAALRLAQFAQLTNSAKSGGRKKAQHRLIFARIDIDDNELPVEYAVRQVPCVQLYAGAAAAAADDENGFFANVKNIQRQNSAGGAWVSAFPADSGPLSSFSSPYGSDHQHDKDDITTTNFDSDNDDDDDELVSIFRHHSISSTTRDNFFSQENLVHFIGRSASPALQTDIKRAFSSAESEEEKELEVEKERENWRVSQAEQYAIASAHARRACLSYLIAQARFTQYCGKIIINNDNDFRYCNLANAYLQHTRRACSLARENQMSLLLN